MTHILRWRLPLTHVSSLHSIVCHCSLVQFRCSYAQANRRSLFFSEMGGFLRATLLEKPSFCRAQRIASSETSHPSFQGIWQYGSCRFSCEAHTKSIKICRDSASIVDLRPHWRFCGVGRWVLAYWTWRIVIFRCSAILEYFHPISLSVWTWSRKSRGKSDCLVGVIGGFIEGSVEGFESSILIGRYVDRSMSR